MPALRYDAACAPPAPTADAIASEPLAPGESAPPPFGRRAPDPGAIAMTPKPASSRPMRPSLGRALVLALAAAGGTASPALPAPPPVATARPPAEWTVYHVYLATFRNGDLANDAAGLAGWRDAGYAGGDLAGVLASLDHIRALGADAIWLSPMFAARTSHGYDVTNYFAVGEAVGVAGDRAASLALWRRLRDEAHARGLKLIVDLPLNHASRAYDRRDGDPWQLGPRATGARQSAEKLWESWGAGYRYWDFGHAPTREFLRRVALYWLIEEGADGLRLDYVRGVPLDFWRELAAEVEARAPGRLLLGECWADELGAEGNVAAIAECAGAPASAPFTALLDFPLQIALADAFTGKAPAARIAQVLDLEASRWGASFRPARFLDNHDLARFVDRAGDRAALAAALAFAAAQGGPLVLFYGTETALGGGPVKPGFTDGGRLPMPWAKLDEALVIEVAEILALRRAHPAMRRGERRGLVADGDVVVDARLADGELLLIGINAGESARRIAFDVPAELPPGAALTSLRGAAPAPDGDRLSWLLPPRSTALAVYGPHSAHR